MRVSNNPNPITALAKRRGRFELSFLEICLILFKAFELMDP